MADLPLSLSYPRHLYAQAGNFAKASKAIGDSSDLFSFFIGSDGSGIPHGARSQIASSP